MGSESSNNHSDNLRSNKWNYILDNNTDEEHKEPSPSSLSSSPIAVVAIIARRAVAIKLVVFIVHRHCLLRCRRILSPVAPSPSSPSSSSSHHHFVVVVVVARQNRHCRSILTRRCPSRCRRRHHHHLRCRRPSRRRHQHRLRSRRVVAINVDFVARRRRRRHQRRLRCPSSSSSSLSSSSSSSSLLLLSSSLSSSSPVAPRSVLQEQRWNNQGQAVQVFEAERGKENLPFTWN
jgi:hypothetical protein